ncbi:hypothetical protein L1887_49683 [Cichorium endivia]|nr:hypothetical protein L1887_49683 [Cichorium endivia]
MQGVNCEPIGRLAERLAVRTSFFLAKIAPTAVCAETKARERKSEPDGRRVSVREKVRGANVRVWRAAAQPSFLLAIVGGSSLISTNFVFARHSFLGRITQRLPSLRSSRSSLRRSHRVLLQQNQHLLAPST